MHCTTNGLFQFFSAIQIIASFEIRYLISKRLILIQLWPKKETHTHTQNNVKLKADFKTMVEIKRHAWVSKNISTTNAERTKIHHMPITNLHRKAWISYNYFMSLLTIKVKQYACVENKNITSMTMSLADKLKGWKQMPSQKDNYTLKTKKTLKILMHIEPLKPKAIPFGISFKAVPRPCRAKQK